MLQGTGGFGEKYKPWSLGVVQAVVEKMPPVADGGGLWLDQLDKLTAGQKLALGDWRAVAARCLPGHVMREIEREGRLEDVPDEIPFTRLVMDVGAAMRERFPLPNAATVPKLPWKTDQNPRDYLDKCKETWARNTGCLPGKGGVQQEWFRKAVLEGVPNSVKEAMLSNPDLPGSESQIWERHLIHHLQRAKDQEEGKENEIADAATEAAAGEGETGGK